MAGPEDRNSGPGRSWNRIPDEMRQQIVDLALEKPDLSPRELAVTFTDTKDYFLSEASVYQLLKAHDLITSPAFIVIKAAEAFHNRTTTPNQLWQTDFTYLKVIGWGWFYLSTILDGDGSARRHLALGPPPGEATYWSGRMLARAADVSLRSVQHIREAHQLAPLRTASAPSSC